MITPLLKVAWSFLKLSAHRRERAGAENSGSSSFQRSVSPLPSSSDFSFIRAAARPLTEKDSIVLADFTNMTGDPVFDDTLKQGLSAQLSQSPFLNLLPD